MFRYWLIFATAATPLVAHAQSPAMFDEGRRAVAHCVRVVRDADQYAACKDRAVWRPLGPRLLDVHPELEAGANYQEFIDRSLYGRPPVPMAVSADITRRGGPDEYCARYGVECSQLKSLHRQALAIYTPEEQTRYRIPGE